MLKRPSLCGIRLHPLRQTLNPSRLIRPLSHAVLPSIKACGITLSLLSTTSHPTRTQPAALKPYHRDPPALVNLRRLLRTLDHSNESVETLFRAFIPITLGLQSHIQSSDVSQLARFVVQSAVKERTDQARHPPLQPPPLESSLFIRVLADYTRAVPDTLLLDTITALLPSSDSPLKPLPDVYDSFSRLLLTDMSRLDMHTSSTTPLLILLRSIPSDLETSCILTQLASSPSSASIPTDYLFSSIIASFGISGNKDLALQFLKSLDTQKESQKIGHLPHLSLLLVLISTESWTEALHATVSLLSVSPVHLRQTTLNGLMRATTHNPDIPTDTISSYIQIFNTIFWKSVSNLDPTSLSKLQNGEGPWSSYLGTLIKYYASTNNLSAILSLSEDLDASKVKLSVFASNAILMYLFDCGNRKLALAMFKELSRSKRVNVFTINTMIQGTYRMGGSAKDVISLFNTLRKIHPTVMPDVVTYTMLMDICFKSNLPDLAKRYYRDLIVAKITPSIVTYTSLMDGLLKSNDLPAAIKLFASVPLTSRDTVMHSSLIHKFTLLNDDTSVKSTYQSYRTDTPQNSPDLILFNILLTYFLRTKQSHDSLHTLHELDKHDLSPDSYTATAVIYGLVQNGETASAEPTSLRLLRNKIPLSIHAVTALITGLSHNRDAIGMMRWIRAILLPYPPFQIPRSSLEELAALSRVPVEDVPTLLNQHAEVLGQLSGIVPDYKFYSTCVIGFLRTCALECADAMVRYMVEHRVDGVQDGRVLVLMDRVCAAWNRCGKEDRGESLRELCTKESK